MKDVAAVAFTSNYFFCCNSAIAAILVDNQRVASGSKVAELQQILKKAVFHIVFRMKNRAISTQEG